MPKGEKCRVTNCNNILQRGNVCGTHRWRMAKFKSYDLPTYPGTPNILVLPKLPEGIVKMCDMHGELTLEMVYARFYKGTPSYACKQCVLAGNMRRTFKNLIDPKSYALLLLRQNGVCAICKIPSKKKSNNGKSIKSLCVDHCHSSEKEGVMKIRGLLCDHCNQGLGCFRDSIELLESAIEYLKTYPK